MLGSNSSQFWKHPMELSISCSLVTSEYKSLETQSQLDASVGREGEDLTALGVLGERQSNGSRRR